MTNVDYQIIATIQNTGIGNYFAALLIFSFSVIGLLIAIKPNFVAKSKRFLVQLAGVLGVIFFFPTSIFLAIYTSNKIEEALEVFNSGDCEVVQGFVESFEPKKERKSALFVIGEEKYWFHYVLTPQIDANAVLTELVNSKTPVKITHFENAVLKIEQGSKAN